MALELEQTIMREIGLGQHYNWYNGSGSCGYIAQHAVRRLPEIIQQHVDAGDPIAPPNKTLIALLARVANEAEEDTYSLTYTWQAASDVIRAHMEAHVNTAGKVFRQYAKHIRERYLHEADSRTTYAWRVRQQWGKGGAS